MQRLHGRRRVLPRGRHHAVQRCATIRCLLVALGFLCFWSRCASRVEYVACLRVFSFVVARLGFLSGLLFVVCSFADINECLTNNGGCDSLTNCTNTRGSRVCGAFSCCSIPIFGVISNRWRPYFCSWVSLVCVRPMPVAGLHGHRRLRLHWCVTPPCLVSVGLCRLLVGPNSWRCWPEKHHAVV